MIRSVDLCLCVLTLCFAVARNFFFSVYPMEGRTASNIAFPTVIIVSVMFVKSLTNVFTVLLIVFYLILFVFDVKLFDVCRLECYRRGTVVFSSVEDEISLRVF